MKSWRISIRKRKLNKEIFLRDAMTKAKIHAAVVK